MTGKLNKRENKKKGFTLVELIVVIAILGILAAITIPRFSQYTADASEKALNANAVTVYKACVTAEQNIVASGKKATIDTIVEQANKSITGVSLVGDKVSDTLNDSTFQLAYYTPATASAPSSFTINNTLGSGRLITWYDGVR